MTLPALPPPGSTNWYEWAEGLHNAANEVVNGRLTEDALSATPELRVFHRDLAQSMVKRANILVIDDSTGEGSNASSVHARMLNRLQDKLRAWDGNIGGGFGYVPGRYMTEVADLPVSNVIASQDRPSYGLGRRAITLPTGTRWTLTCTAGTPTAATSVDIFYPNTNFHTGTAEVYVNDTLHGAYVCYGGGNSVQADDRVYSVPDLDPGITNVIEVRPAAVDGGGYLSGGMIYNGDEAAGLTVIDACHAGSTSAFFAAVPTASFWRDEMVNLEPSLLLLGPGLNDEANQNPTPAQFKTNLQSIVDSVRLKTTRDPSVVLMPKWDRGASRPIPWSQYRATMYELADEHDYGVLDIGDIFAANGQSSLLADGTHPNDTGYELWAQSLADYLLP